MAFRFGFVAFLGRPNVGKSTLLNRVVGQPVAIDSPVPQTTRHRIKGVWTTDRGQAVFLDTPGFSKSLDALGTLLTTEAEAALQDADVIVLVLDASVPPGKGDSWIAEKIMAHAHNKPWLVLLNKIDAVKDLPGTRIAYRLWLDALLPGGQACPPMLSLSAKTGRHLKEFQDAIMRRLPSGQAMYPVDAVTDQRLREMSAELIRKQVLLQTREELPHAVAVAIELFDESDPACTRIVARLYVDQPSQKPILIGKGGQRLKAIGARARREIEQLVDGHVFLDLHVKVKQHWRRDAQFLESLGLAVSQ
jgi:GTP-binding protein Era